jgi:hypothetical protein
MTDEREKQWARPDGVVELTITEIAEMETRLEEPTAMLRQVVVPTQPSVWWIEQMVKVTVYKGGRALQRTEEWRRIPTVIKDGPH